MEMEYSTQGREKYEQKNKPKQNACDSK